MAQAFSYNYILRLREMCNKRGKSMAWLARKMDLDEQTVAYWNQGRSQPSIHKLLIVMRILECSFDDLVEPYADVL